MKIQKILPDSIEIIKGNAAESGSSLKICPDDRGTVRLRINKTNGKIGGADWDEDTYLIIDMLAEMDGMVNTYAYFINTDDPQQENLVDIRMIPQRRVKLSLKMDELKSYHYFLETRPGMYKGHVSMYPTHISKMSAIEWELIKGTASYFDSVEIFDIYACDELPDMTVIGEPMVDELGQSIDMRWNTKTKDTDELSSYLRAEYETALKDNSYPQGWSRYGGCLDVKFDATGFFHAHFDGGRWWLVDPDGCGFFSNGMCYGNRMGVYGLVYKMENLFSWLPDENDKTYADCWTTADRISEYAKRNGTEKGKYRKLFNFARANMIRVFGADKWWDAWTTINTARLKRWGFNTLGVGVNNYDDERVEDFIKTARMPYVWTLKNFPLTDVCIFRDFPDVFSDEYREKSEAFAKEQVSRFVGDPYMIGYFVTNEPEWKSQNVNLAERTFAHTDRLASKTHIIKMLEEKYGDIAKLNAAWGSDYPSFEALYTPCDGIKGSDEDMKWLHDTLLKKYSSVTGDALKAVDPDHMNLGMRYSKTAPNLLAGSESYDAYSFNRYAPDPTQSLDEVSQYLDMPIVIGEWHIGGGDKGLFAHGLLGAPTQEERGKCCSYYLERAISHKNCVGAHYFEMNDQPLLGRFDGECMEHGVIDVCNRPYDELIKHFTETNGKLYEFMRGEVKPTKAHGICYKKTGEYYEY